MQAGREGLYRFPWSTTDSQSGWVEVTDRCDMACPGCYRSSIEGPRRFEDVVRDIVACQGLTNCDSLSIAGGEPLTYPRLADVVRFIAERGMKPVVLTNGLKLTPRLAAELKQAGLAKIHFHVDSVQQRPGWLGCTEAEVNALRQHFADMLWDLGGVQCGFHATVYRSNLAQIGDVVRFCRANIHKVQHLSLIAFRALPRTESLEYRVRGRPIRQDLMPSISARPEEIGITTHEMLQVLQAELPWMNPCAFIGGTPEPRVDKHLVVVNVGTPREVLGSLGARTVELVQVVYHLFNGRYCSFLRRTEAGRRLFVLGLVDPEVRRAVLHYLRAGVRRPALLLDRIYTQSLNLQQPIEILEGRTNLCDTCINPMAFGGRLIPPCQLDDYRMFGAALEPCRVKPHANDRGDRPCSPS